MTTQQNLMDVTCGSRSKHRAAALLLAAGAAIVLLLGGPAAGADAPTTEPTAAVFSDPTAAPVEPARIITPPAMRGDTGATTQPSDATPTTGPAIVTGATTQPSVATRAQLITDGLNKDGSVTVLRGHTMLLSSRVPLKRVSIGQPTVADVNAISPTTLIITAKTPGTTELIVWDEQEHSQVINMSVEFDLEMLKQQLKATFPTLKIDVGDLNDAVSLRGHVPSQQVAEQIMEMTATYGKVHNFLEISGGQQVMLQVRFAEVSKSAVRNLGVNFGGTDGISAFTTTGFGGGSNTFNLAPGSTSLLTGTNSSANLFGFGRFNTTPFDYFITALRQNGLVKTLAEPNLIAISGQEASFIAGGEIPVPVPQASSGGGTVITIEYHEFGVKLNFTPLVLGDGKIRLKVAPEVSDLDFSDAVTISGFSVPGFTKRRVQTTIELDDGQSFALAGLLNNKVNATANSIPLLGDIPILGQLFRSTQYARNETELVVLVTPRLVEAMNPDQVTSLPGEHWRYPNELQTYLFNDLGGPVSRPHPRNGPIPRFHGAYGFTPVGNGATTPSGN